MNSRMIKRATLLVLTLLVAITGSNSASAQTPRPLAAPEANYGDPKNFIGPRELYTLLNHANMDSAANAALAEYEYRVGTIFVDQLGDVAEDSLASVASRINALNIIAQSGSPRQFEGNRLISAEEVKHTIQKIPGFAAARSKPA